MAFSKSFPRRGEGSYPVWEDIYLTKEEETESENKARKENYKIMAECIKDAQLMFEKMNLTRYQPDIMNVATSLFEKRASHEIFFKEALCKEKFDKKYNE
ncbi:MAG: hypothetical protein ACLFUO_05065 [Candidatus Woesearchaeota archaeon]